MNSFYEIIPSLFYYSHIRVLIADYAVSIQSSCIIHEHNRLETKLLFLFMRSKLSFNGGEQSSHLQISFANFVLQTGPRRRNETQEESQINDLTIGE